MSDVLAPRKPSRTKHRPAASNICWRFCSCLTGSTFRTPHSFKLEHSVYHINKRHHVNIFLIDGSINLLNWARNMSVRRLEPSAGSALVERGCGRRRAALSALRSSLAGLGTYVLLSSLPHSAAAADVDIQAVYEVTFAGLAVANANLSVAVRGGVYTARINYRTSGAAGLMSGATGEAVSRGAYESGRFIPATFDLDHKGRQRAQKVALVITGGASKEISLYPPS